MKTFYAVMIQNEDRELPEFCGWDQHIPSLFETKEECCSILLTMATQ